MKIRQSLRWLAFACALIGQPVLAQPLLDLSIGLPATASAANYQTMRDPRVRAWKAKPLTANDVAHEIRFLKSGGMQLPDTDKLDMNSLLLNY